MLGEVIPDVGVQSVLVAAQVGGGDGDKLAISGRDGVLSRPGKQVVGFGGEQGSGHEQGRGVVRCGPVEDLRGDLVVAADQPADQAGNVIGHKHTVGRGADDGLTVT